MKLAISNIAWEVQNDEKVYEIMRRYGFTGLEIAPTRWVLNQPYGHIDEAQRIAKRLESEYGLEIPSMQSIWYGRNERLFETELERKILTDYTKEAINYAERIQCKNLVFGCPRNRNVSDSFQNSQAVRFFSEIAEYAYEHHTCVSMEANPPIYNTNYFNTTTEAIELVQEVNSKGFRLNLDLGTMIENKESLSLIEDKIALINHIHISEPGLIKIEKRKMHKELAELLKQADYNHFLSIEMSKREKMEEIEEVLAYTKEVFG